MEKNMYYTIFDIIIFLCYYDKIVEKNMYVLNSVFLICCHESQI